MKLSVIIPCYNVARYVERAVARALEQDLDDYEVILVNDGSTDNLLEVCEQWRELDNVRIISTPNMGVSHARNVGIEAAQGEYLFFADADDWMEAYVLKTLYRKCKECDADGVRFSCRSIEERTRRWWINNNFGNPKEMYEGEEIVKEMLPNYIGYSLEELKMYGRVDMWKSKELSYVWSFVLKRDTLIKNNIRFVEGLNYMEDKLFLCEFLSCANRIVIHKEVCYNYLRRNGGLRIGNYATVDRYAKNRIQAERYRCELADRIQKERGIDLLSMYKGTLVLSSFEMLIKVSKVSVMKAYRYVKEYRQNPSVARAFKDVKWSGLPKTVLLPVLAFKCHLVLPLAFVLKAWSWVNKNR